MLTSGRNKPADDQNHYRGEGIAIVLSDQAVMAWKASGRHWKAWSSRIISACLKLKNEKLHVFSSIYLLSYKLKLVIQTIILI